MTKLEEKIQKLERELQELTTEQEKINKLPESYRLADLIHEKTCHANHTDGCGYCYESWDGLTSNKTKMGYVVKAENMLKITSFETASEIVSCL